MPGEGTGSGLSLPDPKDDGDGDEDHGEEGMSASVVTGGDTTPILTPAEGILDAVALAIERGVAGNDHFAILARWNAERNATGR